MKSFDFRLFIAYRFGMDSHKQNGALLIAACIVAAIRLRGEPIARSPKVIATIPDSVQLAKMVLSELKR
jgi:hypothetical protein